MAGEDETDQIGGSLVWKRVRIALAVIAMLLVGVAVAAGLWTYSQVHRFQVKNAPVKEKLKPTLVNKPPGEPFYMVLLGEDKRPGDEVGNSDTLIVAYIDPPRKRVSLMSIPRDMRVRIPGHGMDKINAAAPLGGPELAIKTVKNFTGLPISHYVIVDFNGFKDLVDAIGGVRVDVPTDIEDSNAANHDFHAKVINKGVQNLDGKHALTFVRSRKFKDGDFTRIKHQQIFLRQLATQTMQAKNVVKVPAIVDVLMNYVSTDLSVEEIVGLASDFREFKNRDYDAAMLPGTPEYIGDISYVIPDKPGIREMCERMEAGQSLVPPIDPRTIDVAVMAGAGQSVASSETAAFLKSFHFEATDLGPSRRHTDDKTLIVYREDEAKASRVHDQLGYGRVLSAADEYNFKTDVLVIVGKDARPLFPGSR